MAIFCNQMSDAIFSLYNSVPHLDPRRHLHILCLYVATFYCPKGILGLGGGEACHALKHISYACTRSRRLTFVIAYQSADPVFLEMGFICIKVPDFLSFFNVP